jgi:uncharacterized peroxidase-related enzyme
MPFIQPIADDDATAEQAQLLAGVAEGFGYVPNLARVFAHRPVVFGAWVGLKNAVESSMEPRRYELVTLAAALALRSSYCSLAHGRILATMLEPETLRAIVADRTTAGLDAVDVAVMDMAAKVATDSASIEAADHDRLRRLGLTDAEIFDVVLAASIRCFFSKALDGAGAQPDAVYRELEPGLRDALTVGRAIAAG